MGQKQIRDKLNDHLLLHNPMDEECHIVYLLAETRKILEREKREDRGHVDVLYSTLKFYCDWALHTKKSKITIEIKQIMTRIDKEITLDSLKNGNLNHKTNISFIYMDTLREELGNFLSDYGLPQDIVSESSNWLSFTKLLTGVLTDQPIENPILSIKSFSFKIPFDPNTVIWIIKFNDDRGAWYFRNDYKQKRDPSLFFEKVEDL